MVDISIVIVSWNAKAFLLDCLESLNKQKVLCSMEIIVVDNASQDGSPQAVKACFPQVKVIENGDNLGFAKANNIGIEQCHGRYICLVNSDVKVLNGCLQKMLYFMDKSYDIGILGPKIFNGDMTIQSSCRKFPSLWTNFCRALAIDKVLKSSKLFSGEELFYLDYSRIQRVDAISGCFMMVRREAIREVGLLDDRFFIYSEDVDWCKRFHEAGWKVTFYPEAEAIHYGGGSSKNAPLRFSSEQERAMIQYWEKHYGIGQTLILYNLLFLKHLVRIFASGTLSLLYPSKRSDMTEAFEKHLSGIKFLWVSRNKLGA